MDYAGMLKVVGDPGAALSGRSFTAFAPDGEELAFAVVDVDLALRPPFPAPAIAEVVGCSLALWPGRPASYSLCAYPLADDVGPRECVEYDATLQLNIPPGPPPEDPPESRVFAPTMGCVLIWGESGSAMR